MIGQRESQFALILDLGGPLSLRDEQQVDRTPRARKAQGLLALLGTSPGLKRSRSWLQDKLWSDRGPEQGAASLRQCLTEIRSVLGPYVDCLATEGGWVGLDPNRVGVRTELPEGAVDDVEFLEGLDVRDPEFEDWLRDQRLARAERPAAPPAAARLAPSVPAAATPALFHPVLMVMPAEAGRADLRALGEMVAETAAMQVAESGNGQVVRALPDGLSAPPIGLRLLVRATEIGPSLYLQLRLSDLVSGTVVWIGLREIPTEAHVFGPQGPLSKFVTEAASVAGEELARMADRATDQERLTLLGYQASRHTVLLDPSEQRAADQLLAEAFELQPKGIYLARRALLRHNQVYERTVDDPLATLHEAVDFAERAYQLDPNNATVIAVRAKMALNLQGRLAGGFELAKRAVRLGPTNPLAWESLSIAHTRMGEFDEAHAAALRAREFAGYLPQTYLWDVVCCITATGSGRYEEAIRFGERARDLAPTFKPPLRYLAALYYHTGAIEAAAEHLRQLKGIEPDFSLEMLVKPDYPVPSLRRTPLIAVANSGLL